MENEALSLKIVRKFNVTPEVVFDVFTKPEMMRIWWTETTTFDIDLKVGGRWTIMRPAGEAIYIALGEYLEIEKPNKLVYSYAMPQFSPNTDTILIDIVAEDEGSIMTFQQVGKDIDSELKELPKGEKSGSEIGWNQAFDMMERVWSIIEDLRS